MPGWVDTADLAKSVLLQGVPEAELEQLAEAMQRRVFRRNAIVCHQGEPGHSLYLICKGRVKIVVPSEAGDEAVLTVLGAGDTFGEMSLLDSSPRSASVVALEEVETAVLQRDDFKALLRRSPDAVDSLVTMLAQTIRRLTGGMSDLMFLDQQGRLAKKLIELAESHGRAVGDTIEIDAPLTQEELAMMIGARRPTVSRLISFFEDRGILGRNGRRIVIRNPGALRRWVTF